MKHQLTDLIVQRLNDSAKQLNEEFNHKHPIQIARHFALDNLLPNEIALKLPENFPKPRQMRLLSGSGECKLKYIHLKKTPPLLQDITYALQDARVISAIKNITKFPQLGPDPSPDAGGVTALIKGHFINPHVDNSHDAKKTKYRILNLLYYVSPNWKQENGGNLELWDESVSNRIIIPCFFNRLVVMETNQTSWHGVNPVLSKAPRCCIFNYLFSDLAPAGKDYFHKTSFSARPEQKIRRTLAKANKSMKVYAQKIFKGTPRAR